MDGSFILLFFVIVIGLPLLFTAYKQRLKLRERELELLGPKMAEQHALTVAQNERLEQRVRILEQIVTDRGVDTAAQIEALRPPRLSGKQVS